MKIQICSIGNELLLGSTLNRGGSYLCRRLLQAGYRVEKMQEISDDPGQIEQVLAEALDEASLVITTGGLGPTFDDKTRDVVCQLFGTSLAFNQELKSDLERRFGADLASLEDQSMQPEGAELLFNPLGTAPGIFLSAKGKSLMMLPGVPSQMEQIFEQEGLTKIKRAFPSQTSYEVGELHLALVVENEANPLLKELQEKTPEVELGIYPGCGTLTIRGVSESKERLEAVFDHLRRRFHGSIYSETSPSLPEAFHQRMIAGGKTFVAAESCSGGALASKLTAIPDASLYFLGSMVTYSNEMKTDLLGVEPDIFLQHGAVSEECVFAMARGALDRFNATHVAAISGIAGPGGGTPDKPVGTIWICYGTHDNLHAEKVPVRPHLSRELMVEYTVNYVLARLLEAC